MEIRVYDEVDPLGVLALSLSSLDFVHTPERASLIRRLDQRPFPFLALYALVDGIVAGQVGVFRLPVMTLDGPEDMGGIWAVSVLPSFRRKGIATELMEEAHQRMREAGLRFSTLGTRRSLVAHRMYHQLGYEDVHIAEVTVARAGDVMVETTLGVEKAADDSLIFADEFYDRMKLGKLGFSRRQQNFISALAAAGSLNHEVWLIRKGSQVVGYALTSLSRRLLTVDDLLLELEINVAEALTSLIRTADASYVRVFVEYPSIKDALVKAGFPNPLPGYGSFMIKALSEDVTVAEAKQLMAIGTDRFMISTLDKT